MTALFNWAFDQGRFWRRCALTSPLGVPDHETLKSGSVVLVRLGEGHLCTPGHSGWAVSRPGLEALFRRGTLVPWTRRFQKVAPQIREEGSFPCTPSEQPEMDAIYAGVQSTGILTCNPDLVGMGFTKVNPEDVVFEAEDPALSDASFTQHRHRSVADFLSAVSAAEGQECLCVGIPRERVFGFVNQTAKEMHLVPLSAWVAYRHWCLHVEGKLDPRWEAWGQKYLASKPAPVKGFVSQSPLEDDL